MTHRTRSFALLVAAGTALGLVASPEARAAGPDTCQTSACHRTVGRAKIRHAALDEGCGLCHEGVSPAAPGGGHEKGTTPGIADQAALCGNCHDAAAAMATARGRHGPAAGGRCTGCHDPHAANEKALLRAVPEALCATCHVPGPAPARPHAPVAERACTACHAVHGGPARPALTKAMPELCTDCHDGVSVSAPAGGSVHGPVEAGECTACHAAHGSNEPALVVSDFPSGQAYRPWAVESYRLCFGCHDATLVDEGAADTGFQDKGVNLHRLHVVNDRKGRTCRLCHDLHASPQAHLIRPGVPFGSWTLPIKFEARAAGGTCLTACHGPKTYSGRAAPAETPAGTPSPAAAAEEK